MNLRELYQALSSQDAALNRGVQEGQQAALWEGRREGGKEGRGRKDPRFACMCCPRVFLPGRSLAYASEDEEISEPGASCSSLDAKAVVHVRRCLSSAGDMLEG
jgi:hypothetical protein